MAPGYARAIDEVASLDPESSLAAGYLHQVVRHAALWLMANARAEPMDLGEVGISPPRACSNPDPPKAILERPLGPLDLARYLVAAAAMDLGIVDHFDGLHGRLSHGPILGLEIARSKQAADHAVASGDPDRLIAALAPHAVAAAHLRDAREALEKGDMMDPARGMPPAQRLDGTEPDVARTAALDLLLSFATLRAFEGDWQAIGRARAALNGPGFEGLWTVAKLMVGAEGSGRALSRYTPAQCNAMLQAAIRHDYGPPVLACVPQLADKQHALAASIDAAYKACAAAFCRSPMAARFRVRDWAAGCAAFAPWRDREGSAVARAADAAQRRGRALPVGAVMARVGEAKDAVETVTGARWWRLAFKLTPWVTVRISCLPEWVSHPLWRAQRTDFRGFRRPGRRGFRRNTYQSKKLSLSAACSRTTAF